MGYRFDEDTAVSLVAAGRYSVQLHRDWSIGNAMHGGYVLAVACRAALADDAHPDLVSVAANFLRRAEPGAAEAVVERTRTGRRMGFSRVQLVQDGTSVLDAIVTTGALNDDPPVWTEVSEVDNVPPDFETAVPEWGGFRPPMQGLRDVHLDPRMPFLRGDMSGPPVMSGWLRFSDGRDPDALAMAYLCDALPPVTFAQGRIGWVPTIQLSLSVRAKAAPGPCWVTMRGGVETGGYVDEQFEVWDGAGRLVAHGYQLAGSPRA
jgi:acyl-coenzyme A thioesterase PaaI-like protein